MKHAALKQPTCRQARWRRCNLPLSVVLARVILHLRQDMHMHQTKYGHATVVIRHMVAIMPGWLYAARPRPRRLGLFGGWNLVVRHIILPARQDLVVVRVIGPGTGSSARGVSWRTASFTLRGVYRLTRPNGNFRQD